MARVGRPAALGNTWESRRRLDYPRTVYHLLVKLGALLSFCGGPLILFEVMKPRLGTEASFGVAFLPIVLMIVGSPSLRGEDLLPESRRRHGMDGGTMTSGIQRPWLWEIRFVRLGSYGAMIALIMHVYGAWILTTTTILRADRGLCVVGLIVGIPVAVGYAYSANRWLKRVTEPAADPSPIEPS